MSYDCGIIKDLLPLVQDDTASPASKSAVREHLAECPSCRRYYEEMNRGTEQAGAIAETEETDHYQQLARRLRIRSVFTRTGIALILGAAALLSYVYVGGVRLEARQAAETNRYVDEESVLLGEARVGTYHVFFYENEDKYRTIVTKKAFLAWKSSGASSWANKTGDPVKLVGWTSLTDADARTGITTVPVQSFDRQVAYIEMGPEPDRSKQGTPYGETVVFAWDRAIRWNDLNGIAYSGEGKPLYKLGYEVVNNLIRPDELRWLPVNP
ncbi:MAG: hypothetical protein K0R57_272 [Paenibacillaceae bacterium]|nr:hypothetical protein [Paenibacillaceae bacterium]